MPAKSPSFLAEGGEMGELIRRLDWRKTPLGAPVSWPAELRTLVRVMLAARQPMFIAWGPSRTMLYNDAYAPLCGARHPWALGKPFNAVWADIIDTVGPIMEAAYAGVSTSMDDIAFTMTRNGYPEETHFSFGYTPVHDDLSGDVLGMFCTCLENTQEVIAGRERRKDADRLREMFRQAPGAMALLRGPDHVFEIVNKAYRALIGHREVEGRPIRLALPEVEDQGFVDLLDRVFQTGEPFIGHAMPVKLQRQPDGPSEERLLDFVYQPIRDDSDTITGIFVEATDVSDRVSATRALSDANERLRLALSAGSGLGTWDWDVQADRVTADERFANLFGVDPKLAAEGAPIKEFFARIHPEDLPRVQGEIQQALRTGEDFASEYRVLRENGEPLWIIAQGRCARGNDGTPLHFPGVAFDITDRRVAENATRTAKEDRDFIYALANEQRNSGSPEKVMALTAERLGRYLGITRVGFYSVSDNRHVHYQTGWSDGTLPVPEGSVTLASFGEDYQRTLRGGRPFIFEGEEPVLSKGMARVRSLGTQAGMNIPLIRGKRWEAGLYASHAVPRRWSERERLLVEEVAQLAWDAVERSRAEAVMRRRAALLELSDRLRDLTDPVDIAYAGAETLGTTLGVSRAGYGTIDPVAETITVERDWNAPGIKTIAGTLHFRDHGSYIDDLKRGDTALVTDSRTDPRTADTSDVLEAISARSFVNMPLTENNEFVALLYLNHAEPRLYTEDDLSFMREVAERTRAAVERRRVEGEIKALNALLEERVAERTAERNLLATVLETTDAFVQVVDPNFRWLAINKAAANEFEQIYGVRPEVGQSILEALAPYPDHQAAIRGPWQRAINGEEFTLISEFGHSAHARRFYELKFNALRDKDGQLIAAYQFAYDVSERLAAQARLAKAEDQVRQMQKMEAVGQLTGGIAHDFNNMMAVVIGGLNLLQRRLARGDTDVGRFIDGAMDGAERAASLTQRLLAFSRQQPLTPEAVDPNAMLEGMIELLSRTLGDNIRIETVLERDIWRTRADPSQLENAILNLCVNARDAMADGGQLTLQTANVSLEGDAAQGIEPGPYVRIAVTDTGSGMSEDVIAKAFDPFFTTKGVGKGTGLGLSQVFGFIRQSDGQVRIHSELGSGTTVSIYLPRFQGEADSLPRARQTLSTEGARSGEIVMVVEDEERVRAFSVDALRELGYKVVETANATEALRLIESGEKIDLLFTDIMMPDMSGRQLSELALRARPYLRVLFTSGYTGSQVMGDRAFDTRGLLPKPFSLEQLASKVREALDV
ncbi:PAS domain-containing protein [Mesorhizobium sp. RP14(2022)]|uniref:histidine kinase n=1 Tax=Mesorhizobium liriopis TaxID=2953882 RepID=A0ABT1C6M3_9HYPH|nr:PAS domain-containing protein [Mesorhizobium liriopis]MCO6050469.1 PAS domain-containing protein [Mesorhizobium liriopis]